MLYGIRPLVADNKRGNYVSNIMERYATVLVMTGINMSGIGSAQITNEGCLADLLVLVGNLIGRCMATQTKTTRGPKREYRQLNWRFNVPTSYEGMLMILRSLTDGKMWMIPYSTVKPHLNSQGIYISTTVESQNFWRQFEVSDADIPRKILEYYALAEAGQVLRLFDVATIMTPSSVDHQRESQTNQRVTVALGLTATPVDNLPYDRYYGRIRVQLRHAGTAKGKSALKVSVSRSRPKTAGNKSDKYRLGDFDALIAVPDTPKDNRDDVFYFIPMSVLVEQGIIGKTTDDGKQSFYVYLPTSDRRYTKREIWEDTYSFRYDRLDLKSAITELCRKHNLVV